MKRYTTLVLAGTITACATSSPPATYAGISPAPMDSVHQCVTREVVSRGYTVRETSRADGTLLATKPLQMFRFQTILQVLIYENSEGLVLQVDARVSDREGNTAISTESMHLPTIEDARTIVEVCTAAQ
jgi:hypothetical protein